MDSNLYFRFSIPGWTGLLTGTALAWTAGRVRLTDLCDASNKDSVAVAVAVLVALLGAPAVGFLLNTLIVAVCHWLRWGPEHSESFAMLWDVCARRAGDTPNTVERVFRSRRDRTIAALMAHFEYRLDPDALIDWRRRQRAAFYANLANLLAVSLGMALSHSYWCVWPLRCETYLALICTVFLGICLAYNAQSARALAEKQQKLWVSCLEHRDVQGYLCGLGTGLSKDGADVGKQTKQRTMTKRN